MEIAFLCCALDVIILINFVFSMVLVIPRLPTKNIERWFFFQHRFRARKASVFYICIIHQQILPNISRIWALRNCKFKSTIKMYEMCFSYLNAYSFKICFLSIFASIKIYLHLISANILTHIIFLNRNECSTDRGEM